jgi:hypothetical protein
LSRAVGAIASMRLIVFSSATAALDVMDSQQAVGRPAARTGIRVARILRGGTEGNARLTALTGLVLLVLLAAEGVTILAIRPLLSVHVFVGLLLIPPVALKLATTGYRFFRYYTRDLEYLRSGPPILFMRMLVAPGLVVSTLGVFATGVALLVVGPGGGIVLGLHKASFVVWIAAFGIHVLVYLLRAPALVGADWGRGTSQPGAGLRYGAVASALVAGLTLAIAALPAVGPWLHWAGSEH